MADATLSSSALARNGHNSHSSSHIHGLSHSPGARQLAVCCALRAPEACHGLRINLKALPRATAPGAPAAPYGSSLCCGASASTSTSASSSASAAPPSPSSSAPGSGASAFNRGHELSEYAWVYGAASLGSSGGFSSGASLRSSSHHLPCTACTHPWACRPTTQAHQSVDASTSVQHEDASSTPSQESESPPEPEASQPSLDPHPDSLSMAVAYPPISLGAHIRDSFQGSQESCAAQLARLGHDKDADVVHDLRVALRRLRNMLSLFAPYLDLSKELAPKQVSRLLRALGVVRDTGAMMETLETVEGHMQKRSAKVNTGAGSASEASPAVSDNSDAPAAAAAASQGELRGGVLEGVRARLQALEKEHLAEALKVLHSKSGQRLLGRLEACVAKEEALLHSAITSSSRNGKKGSKAKKGGGKEGRKVSAATAERQGILLSPLSSLAPSLLSAHVNATLLHPAWHIEDIWVHKETDVPVGGRTREDAAAGAGLDALELNVPVCETVHDLRKHLRELRYAMELLAPVYSQAEDPLPQAAAVSLSPSLLSHPSQSVAAKPAPLRRHYGHALGKVKELQGVLGDLQDLQVLGAYLRKQQEEGEQLRLRRAARARKATQGKKRKGKQAKSKRGGKGETTAHAPSDGAEEDRLGLAAVAGAEVSADAEGLSGVLRAVGELERKVWARWLREKEVVSGPRGRYKLSKAVLMKPGQDEEAAPKDEDARAGSTSGVQGDEALVVLVEEAAAPVSVLAQREGATQAGVGAADAAEAEDGSWTADGPAVMTLQPEQQQEQEEEEEEEEAAVPRPVSRAPRGLAWSAFAPQSVPRSGGGRGTHTAPVPEVVCGLWSSRTQTRRADWEAFWGHQADEAAYAAQEVAEVVRAGAGEAPPRGEEEEEEEAVGGARPAQGMPVVYQGEDTPGEAAEVMPDHLLPEHLADIIGERDDVSKGMRGRGGKVVGVAARAKHGGVAVRYLGSAGDLVPGAMVPEGKGGRAAAARRRRR